MRYCNNRPNKIKIFITIDTEDNYFDVPRLITGEGIENTPGVGMIMDILDKYNCKANFFFNAYEHINYKDGVLRDIAISIFKRGHEIDLHTHPNEKSTFYKRAIYNYPLEHQIEILEYGKKLIYDWVGVNPAAHRGGVYACSDDTLTALCRVGIPIDSSFWFNAPHNVFANKFTTNKITRINNTIEVPVTYVDYVKADGMHGASKFDIDWLQENELIEVIEQAKQNNLKSLTLFLHSFSFLQKINKDVSQQSDPRAKFVSNPSWGKFCAQIIGINDIKIKRLEKVLEYICNDESLEICTFRDWYQSAPSLEDLGEDFVPIINYSS